VTAQARHGRRGAVFSVRVTDEERGALEAAQRRGGGPRRLGPWLVWRALSGEVLPGPGGHYPAGTVVPRGGITGAGASGAAVVPGAGSTGAAPVLPELGYYPGDRRILDLCAGSGSWSAPYAAAGYDVIRVSLPDADVRTFVIPDDKPVWGVLAAPPCDQFSLARNGHASPRDFVRGMECVNACMRIIGQARPTWWALENPVGLLSKWLGTPRDVWEPCDFGDPWTKRTAIWGEHAIPRRGPFVEPVGGGPLCAICDPGRRRTSWCSNAAHRAVTPPGFARAFYLANL
jgi:hypothetical protein